MTPQEYADKVARIQEVHQRMLNLECGDPAYTELQTEFMALRRQVEPMGWTVTDLKKS